MMDAMRLWAIFLILGAAGCSEVTPQTYDRNACQEFIVPHAFGLAWTNLNHRISEWKIRPSHEDCLADELFVRHVGGDFSTGDAFGSTDDPILTFGYQQVRADRQEVGVARVSLKGVVGPDGVWTVEETYNRSALNLRHYKNVSAVIEGLTFDTDTAQLPSFPSDYNAAHGYTMRGFGASAEVSDLSSEQISVLVSTQFQTGDAADRPELNVARQVAQIETSIDVLLIATAENVEVETASHELSQTFGKPEPLEDLEIPDPPIADQRVDLEIDPTSGFRGISKFHYDFNFVPTCENDGECLLSKTCLPAGVCRVDRPIGDYLREIRVVLDSDDDGLLFNGYASNSSTFLTFFGLDYRFTGDVVWINSEVEKSESTISESFKTGTKTFGLAP